MIKNIGAITCYGLSCFYSKNFNMLNDTCHILSYKTHSKVNIKQLC